MRPVLHELASQAVTLSVYAAETGGVTPLSSQPVHPVGMACVTQIDDAMCSLVLKMTAPILPLPVQTMVVAHMNGGVRVQWPLQGEWLAQEGNQWRMEMAWPAEILLLQRRRHPRVSVPLGQSYSASFLFGRRLCTLDIDDLSAGGIALRGTRQETSMLFMGRALPQVTLSLADGAVLTAALKVRSRRRYQSFLLGEQVLVGCSVEHMSSEDSELLAQHLTQAMTT